MCRDVVGTGPPARLWAHPGAGPAGLHHALMAGAMIWMLTAMPGAAGMPAPRHDHDAMAGMPQAGMPGPVLAVCILAAGYCAAASVPWLRRAIGPRNAAHRLCRSRPGQP